MTTGDKTVKKDSKQSEKKKQQYEVNSGLCHGDGMDSELETGTLKTFSAISPSFFLISPLKQLPAGISQREHLIWGVGERPKHPHIKPV